MIPLGFQPLSLAEVSQATIFRSQCLFVVITTLLLKSAPTYSEIICKRHLKLRFANLTALILNTADFQAEN